MAEFQLPKLATRVRFPSPAPATGCRTQDAPLILWGGVFYACYARVYGQYLLQYKHRENFHNKP